MSTLVFFLEEPSAREMLQGVVPRLVPETVSVRYIPFEGKQDMSRQLERKLRGWLAPDTCFIVLRDQDSGDCMQVKQELAQLCCTLGARILWYVSPVTRSSRFTWAICTPWNWRCNFTAWPEGRVGASTATRTD